MDAYNKAVGSLERNVLPQARRFNDLGVGVVDSPMPEADPIDSMPRLLQAPELVPGEQEPQRADSDHPARHSDGPVRMLPFSGTEAIRSRGG